MKSVCREVVSVSNRRVREGVWVGGVGTAGCDGTKEKAESCAPLITVSFGAKSGLNDA